MTKVDTMKNRIEICKVKESYGFDFYVYVDGRFIRTCPSQGMAEEVAAGAID